MISAGGKSHSPRDCAEGILASLSTGSILATPGYTICPTSRWSTDTAASPRLQHADISASQMWEKPSRTQKMVEKKSRSPRSSPSLDTTGTCCVPNTLEHTPFSQESGAAVRSWKKTALAHFPSVLPAESSFPTLLNKGGLILYGLTPTSAELVLSPAVPARTPLPAMERHHSEDQDQDQGQGDLLGQTFTPSCPSPRVPSEGPPSHPTPVWWTPEQELFPQLQMPQVLGRSGPPGLLSPFHPSVGIGPSLHGWEQAEPSQAPLFQPHALASGMPSKEPFVSLSLPVASPRPPQPFSGHWGSSPPRVPPQTPCSRACDPSPQGRSICPWSCRLCSSHFQSVKLLVQRKKEKKKPQHLAALLLFFFFSL